MPTESELKKLTVPQLKALCKEKRIVGYSKLGKDAIIQKLLTATGPNVPASAEPAPAQTATPAPDNSAIQNPAPSTLTASSSEPSPSNSAPRANAEQAPKPPPKKRKNPPAFQPAETRVPSTSTASSSPNPPPDTHIPHTDEEAAPKPPTTASNPASTFSHHPPDAPDTSTTARTGGDPAPKPPPKKRKNPPTSQLSDAGVSSFTASSPPNPAPDSSIPARADGEPTSKPPPKKRKNPPASSDARDPLITPIPSTSTAPSPSNPTQTELTLSQSTQLNPAPDTSVSARVDGEPVAKPRPKKRKNPPVSESESQGSLPGALNHAFKMPALPQRLTQDSTSKSVSTAPISSTSTSVSSTATSTASTSAATTTKKRKTAADKSSTDATAPKKRKTATAKTATDPTVTPAPSAPTAPKKKTTVPPTTSTPSVPKAATRRTFTLLTVSSARTDSRVDTDTVQPTVDPVSDQLRNIPKRPMEPAPTDPLPPKRQKLAPLLPISKPFGGLLPQTTAPSISPIVPHDAAKLPQSKPKRFVPLVVARKSTVPPAAAPPPPSISTAVSIILSHASASETLHHLDFPASPPPPPLTSITLPAKKSERKHVPRLALVLSFLLGGMADEDIRNCLFASRVFRYAVYLSAANSLSRDFAGKRLSLVLANYSQTTPNMWPYLQQRQQELFSRKDAYRSSFLGRVFPGGTKSPISERLWTSPDHERQIVIALRFLLTRLFFSVSVGGGREGKGWDEGQIVDTQELVKNEVWTVTVRHSRSPTSTSTSTEEESFYVLEPTCEPLTAAVPDSDSAVSLTSTGVPVRADWSAYIASAAQQKSPALLDCLSWTNHEEYERGISQLWLRRIEGEGAAGRMKRVVAERYILACVVANRRVLNLSGRYMSATQMAQDFAGLPEGATPVRVTASPKVNLFLPAHHHVESVHFATAGRALHSALAIVQTPGRIYFILRDNGMQVGCEEEGVAEVWMSLLGCDNLGMPSRK
ncbi:hypothetical protein K438DRAFT_1667040 [Mycena galopus ATCC 62051]|nr:hypothetical protein K438DRAFT_1667040 [Mycena galopus ATCC 62051]